MKSLFTPWVAAVLSLAAVAGPGKFRSYFFEENLGQVRSGTKFVFRQGRHTLYLDSKGTTSVLDGKDTVRMSLVGSQGASAVTGADPHTGVSNFVARGPGKDIVGARHFGRVILHDVYPSIDLSYYINGTELEYDFIVRPGADASKIAIDYSGAKPALNADGVLVLQTKSGELRQQRPRVYQMAGKRQVGIVSAYRLHGGRVSFKLAAYDRSKELVIDPPINYLTYLGTTRDESYPSIKADGAGNAYVTNYNQGIFPVTKYGPTGQIVYATIVNTPGGVPYTTTAQAVDASGQYFLAFQDFSFDTPPSRIVKLTASGTLLYDIRVPGTQYLVPKAAAADNDGNNYVCGQFTFNRTGRVPADASALHPTLVNPTISNNGFLMKFGPNGQVLYATYLPSFCETMTIDPGGNAYVLLTGVSIAQSPWTLKTVFGSTAVRPGVEPFGALIGKINPTGTAILQAVNFRYHDISYLAAGSDGALYVGAQYMARNEYALLVNPLRSNAPPNLEFAEGYFAKVNPDFSSLAWGTLVGGSGKEWFAGMALDPAGNLSFAGYTLSNDVALVNPVQTTNTNTTSDQCTGTLVGQINSAGTAFTFLSYVGGNACLRTYDSANRSAVAADNGGIYVTGTVSTSNLPVVNAAQPNFGGGNADNFVLKLGSTTVPGCSYALGSQSVDLANSGGSGSVTVTTTSNCAFTATTSSSFINITAGGTGSGSRTVTFNVSANAGASRSDIVLIAGQNFTVNQAAATPVMTSVTPNPALPGSRTFTIIGTTFDPATALVEIAGVGTIPNSALTTKTTTQLAFTTTLAVGSYDVIVRNGVGAAASNIIAISILATIPDGSHFVPLAPCRAADTRNPGSGAIAGASFRDFIFTACNLPGNATAVALNVTLVPNGQFGFISIWPAGQTRPGVSTMNSLDGRIKANMAIVGLGTNKAVSIFVTDTAHVILDVNGYFVPAGTAGALAFYPVAPCRVVDTRSTGGIIPAAGTRKIQGGCLPANVQAYSLNVTTVPSGALGFLTLWPDGSAQPVASTLNNLTGTVVANAAILRAGSAGAFNAFVTDQTHLIVDLNGYFATPGQPGALSFYPLQPCRIFDTRNPNSPFGGPRMAADSTRSFTVPSSSCNVPTTAQAYVTNATVVPQGVFGFLTLFPDGVTRPTVSTLNAIDGALHSNAAILPAGSGGVINTYTSDAVHLLLDISGYFAP